MWQENVASFYCHSNCTCTSDNRWDMRSSCDINDLHTLSNALILSLICCLNVGTSAGFMMMVLLASVSALLLIVSLTSITMACFMCQYYTKKMESNRVCVLDVTWEAIRPTTISSYGHADICKTHSAPATGVLMWGTFDFWTFCVAQCHPYFYTAHHCSLWWVVIH